MNVNPHPALSDPQQQALVAALAAGLPLESRPYARIGERIGLSEAEVLRRVRVLQEQGVIKRLGVVVRHHELGYAANAMVVWNIPDDEAARLGSCLGQFAFVTLCYRRPRRLPDWPYNLFTMIHGRDRESVLERIDELVRSCDLEDIPHQVLFSQRRFKQRGARYGHGNEATARGTS